MYHYVRPPEERWSTRHNVLPLDVFERQLDHLCATYQLVTGSEIRRLLRGEAGVAHSGLPLAWLTFDDGYADCVKHVLPALQRRGIAASFFIPTAIIDHRSLLAVNAIHYLLATCSSSGEIVAELRRLWREREVRSTRGETFDELYGRVAIPNAWNDTDSRFIKKTLQRELPPDVRESLVGELLAQLTGPTPATIADELYLRDSDVRTLLRAGMEVGSHGHRHLWLADHDREAQREDLLRSFGILRRIGHMDPAATLSYPFGSYNADTLAIARESGASIGLVNSYDRVADLSPEGRDWLETERIDAMWFERFFGC